MRPLLWDRRDRVTPWRAQVVASVTNLPGLMVLAFIHIIFCLNLIVTLVGLAYGLPCPPWGHCPVPDVPPRRRMAAWHCPLSSQPVMPAGDTATSVEQGARVALSNPCFKDKDKDKGQSLGRAEPCCPHHPLPPPLCPLLSYLNRFSQIWDWV